MASSCMIENRSAMDTGQTAKRKKSNRRRNGVGWGRTAPSILCNHDAGRLACVRMTWKRNHKKFGIVSGHKVVRRGDESEGKRKDEQPIIEL